MTDTGTNGQRQNVQIRVDDPVAVVNWLLAQSAALAEVATDLRKDKPEMEMREVHARQADAMQALLISQASMIRAMTRKAQPVIAVPGLRL